MRSEAAVKLKNFKIETSPDSNVQMIATEDYEEWKKSGNKNYGQWKKEKIDKNEKNTKNS